MNIGKGINKAGSWLSGAFSSSSVNRATQSFANISDSITGQKAINILHSNGSVIPDALKDAVGKSNEMMKKVSNMSHAEGFMGGIQASYNNIATNKMGIMDGIKAAHMKADGSYNLGAIAGSYIGVSAAARIAGGGGVYKDRGGRTNIIGVPFI